MDKEIKFGGLSTVPSDYECGDGELAAVLNLVPEDGSLKPVQPPKALLKLGANQRIVYIHKTSAFTHYIIHDTNENKLLWTSDGSSLTLLHTFSDAHIHQVSAIGNTLIALTDDGIHYFLWKGPKEGYLNLGNEIPELAISFGLQGEMQRTDEFEITFDDISFDWKVSPDGTTYASYHEFSDSDKSKVSSQVLAKVNKFIADRATNKGKFIYPFLVRYAYRLYDGSLIKHSAPVLMICSTQCTPIALWKIINMTQKKSNIRLIGMVHSLDYAVVNNSELTKLKEWSDIVKSVDVFISAPIYTYDQNGECDKFYNYAEYGSDLWGYSVCKHINQAASTVTYPLQYQGRDTIQLYNATFNTGNLNAPYAGVLGLPKKDDATVKEAIRNCNSFYLLESIKVDQLTTKRTIIDVEEDYLQSLVNREVMTDDYDSHDKIISKYAFSYNSRVNLANITKQLYKGYPVSSCFCYTDGFTEFNHNGTGSSRGTVSISLFVCIKQDGRDIVVRADDALYGYNTPFLFVYYPNTNAYKAILATNDKSWIYIRELPLEAHSFLNGAFYFDGWDDLSTKATEVPKVSPLSDRTISIPNKIYTSEINNPFYFPLSGINTVGTGNIIGICSAVKALSQGQFGQFPLYAFTDEGVWALEVSSTGTYSAKQPVTRDVCINAASLTQIDTAVLFATGRGIMLIQGSETVCLTDILNGDNILSVDTLPHMERIAALSGFTMDDFALKPFHEFIGDCRMVYDYRNQRIIVYNPACTYAYIYSLKSKKWGMMQSAIADNVNSYPDALAVLADGTLVNFSEENTDGDYRGIVITRPFKLDMPDIHKTINTIVQRGFFRKGHVRCALYASRDMFNWFLVWTSTDHYLRGFSGTPYKYFRLVLLCDLADDENLSGCSVRFLPRLTNRVR